MEIAFSRRQSLSTTSAWHWISSSSLPKEVSKVRPHHRSCTDVHPEEREALIKKISLLKRNALAAPFELAFSKQQELAAAGQGQGDLFALHYRDEEAIYIQAAPDRVTVFFSTVFREETDRIFGKVFLQVCSMILRCIQADLVVSGICRCSKIILATECASSSVLEQGSSSRTQRRLRSQS